MEAGAVVRKIEGGDALVEVQEEQACGHCHESEGCGSRLLIQLLGPGQQRIYRVRNDIGAVAGDSVIVTVPEGAVLQASFFSYMLPVALVIVGAAVASFISPNPAAADGYALAGAGIGLVIGMACLRLAQHRLGAKKGALLTMTKRTAKNVFGNCSD